jgi:hypothetical protein
VISSATRRGSETRYSTDKSMLTSTWAGLAMVNSRSVLMVSVFIRVSTSVARTSRNNLYFPRKCAPGGRISLKAPPSVITATQPSCTSYLVLRNGKGIPLSISWEGRTMSKSLIKWRLVVIQLLLNRHYSTRWPDNQRLRAETCSVVVPTL